MRQTAREMLRDCSGATAIEYAMIAGSVAVVVLVAVAAVGETVAATFRVVAAAV